MASGETEASELKESKAKAIERVCFIILSMKIELASFCHEASSDGEKLDVNLVKEVS